MADKYNSRSHKLKQRKLNVPNLIKGGALRITEEGPGRPNAPPNKEADPNRFSIVTPLNVQAKSWPNKPKSYKIAAKVINTTRLGDGKYRQIIDSAKKLKMPEDKIFLDTKKAKPRA